MALERGAPTDFYTRPEAEAAIRTPRTSLRSVVVKSIDESAVRRAMDAWAARLLAEHAAVEEIVVFGSFVTGRWAHAWQ